MDTIFIPDGIISTAKLREALAKVSGKCCLLYFADPQRVSIIPDGLKRLEGAVAAGAKMAYGDYEDIDSQGNDTPHPVTDYAEGSVRDDFNFGPLAVVSVAALRDVQANMPGYDYAGWYAARLALSTGCMPQHIKTICSRLHAAGASDPEAAHFAYVNPRNRAVQMEMEMAFTAYLKAIGAWLPERPRLSQSEIDAGDFPVEASVIIPVKNRVTTVAEAVRSALSQAAPFDFNVIVVDNHSTDGTTGLLRSMKSDRLVHIIPDNDFHGIGGCWNLALAHPQCGRFAVQLDSDDLYSSPDTLRRMVDCFRREGCAMAVGSYTLVDRSLRPLPPGVIDHREWTDANGHNNLLRVNGLGAPRGFLTSIARRMPMPDVSYGEDYAMGLQLSRSYRIGRIFDVLYLCRRWEGNSDSKLTVEKANRYNDYKDSLRTAELARRRKMNADD